VRLRDWPELIDHGAGLAPDEARTLAMLNRKWPGVHYFLPEPARRADNGR
jgi:hypothetical protein